MTRKKVDLTYIGRDSKRKATFKKQKNGLIKKIDEISTLCESEACAIIYSPNVPQPEVWPSHLGVRRVISKFKRTPQLEQSKKMLNQESFLSKWFMPLINGNGDETMPFGETNLHNGFWPNPLLP